jgi:hypothetical protein
MSGGNWIGMRLILAFLDIKEYKANMPPANFKNNKKMLIT